ncbi:hypothetical protein ACP26L_02280 [Paenibacillus sp. S-38]|uniref:hypothetical protein n=1 Tax=Paenibacillus sp. S-38 TaxID=3416710 RepID=UPI003CFA9FD1
MAEWSPDWPALLLLLGITSWVWGPWLLAQGTFLPAGAGQRGDAVSLPQEPQDDLRPLGTRRPAVRLLRPPRAGEDERDEED